MGSVDKVFRRWEEPYNRLLEKLTGQFGGEIIKTKRASSLPGFSYSYFKAEVEGYRVMMNISEVPSARGIGAVEAIDSVQYLRLWCYFHLKKDYYIRITHEGAVSRFSKSMGISSEFQTGNKEFDDRYLLELRTERDQKLIKHSDIQYAIRALEPLVVFEVKETLVHTSQAIENKIQLEFDRVNQRILGFQRLAKHIEGCTL